MSASLLRSLALYSAILVLAFLATYSGTLTFPSGSFSPDFEAASPARTSGKELVFVYVGSASCAPSNEAGLIQTIRELRRSVSEQAKRSGIGFRSIGVAKDSNAAVGLKHLERYDQFDEISAGGGWLNTATLRYVFGDLPGAGGTPQLVVVVRDVLSESNDVAVTSQELLVRKVGLTQINKWRSSHGMLPSGVLTTKPRQ